MVEPGTISCEASCGCGDMRKAHCPSEGETDIRDDYAGMKDLCFRAACNRWGCNGMFHEASAEVEIKFNSPECNTKHMDEICTEKPWVDTMDLNSLGKRPETAGSECVTACIHIGKSGLC